MMTVLPIAAFASTCLDYILCWFPAVAGVKNYWLSEPEEDETLANYYR